MSNDYESAAWADNYQHLTTGIAALFDKLSYAFKRLNAIEYDAPWDEPRR
jgi:hypothetical protein